MHRPILITLFILLQSFEPVFAVSDQHGTASSGDCFRCHTLSLTEASKILASLNVQVRMVKAAKVKGLFEVIAERDGKQGVVFVDFSKKYIMQGVLARLLDEKAAVSTDSSDK